MDVTINKMARYEISFVGKLKRLKKTMRDEFLYGCHFLSLSTSAIVLSAMFFMQIPLRWDFCIIAYLLTQTVYTYNHYREFAVDSSVESKRVKHLRRYGTYFPVIVSVYALSYVLFLLVFGSWQGIIFGFVFLILGLIYTECGKKITQKIVGFKSFYTSFSLALFIIFTAVYCGYALDWMVVVFSLFLFLNMSINTTFYDLKDIESDKKQNLRTLPLYLGKYRFLKVLHVLNIVSFLPILLGVFFRVLPLYTLILVVMFGYSFYFIQKAWNPKADLDFLSYVVVDGQYYVLPVLLFIGVFCITF